MNSYTKFIIVSVLCFLLILFDLAGLKWVNRIAGILIIISGVIVMVSLI